MMFVKEAEKLRKKTLSYKENARATPAAPQPSVQYLLLLLYEPVCSIMSFTHPYTYIYNASQGAKLILKGV